MANLLSLTKTIAQSFYLMQKRTASYGEGVRWTQDETATFLAQLPQNPLMLNRFAIAARLKPNEVIYQHNTELYLGVTKRLTIEAYYRLIHLDYLEDYLKWGEIIYQYAAKMRDFLEPMRQCFRITFPMRLYDKQYFWVLMEAYPLQMDADKNMVAHLNIYTVLNRFIPNEKIPLVGDVWDNNALNEDWTHEIWKKYTTHRAFVLTPAQSEIVAVLNQNLDLTHAQIAEQLGKSKNTIDIQTKQILARARDAFDNQYFTTVRELVQFLQAIQFFQEPCERVSGAYDKYGGECGATQSNQF